LALKSRAASFKAGHTRIPGTMMGDPSEALAYLENTGNAAAVTRRLLDPLVEPVCITNQRATTKMIMQKCMCVHSGKRQAHRVWR
jgi:hypothetical protein